MDDRIVAWLNQVVRRARWSSRGVSAMARWLAAVEIALMALLAAGGRRRDAMRMLAAVGLVYLACDALGLVWPRERPFARIGSVEALTPHAKERSFPSRHVASGLAMAAIGGGAHPRVGGVMSTVAWLLGLSRVAAGLHYPSDVLVGAILGRLVGWCFARRM